MDRQPGELLATTSVPASLQLAPPWTGNNVVLAESGVDADGPFAFFARVDPARAGHLIQWCAPPATGSTGVVTVRAEVRASGEGAAGLNVYCYFHARDDTDHQAFPLAHPGDGEWHTLTRAFPLPSRPVLRMRIMLVSRFGDAPLGVRQVTLRFTPEIPVRADPEVSPAFHEAVLATVARHPAAGDPAFREKLYRSLINGNRKGREALETITERLQPAGFTMRGGRFLDLGCGTGGALAAAKACGACWAEGWEITPEKLALAQVNLGALRDDDAGFAILDRSVEDTAALNPDFQPFDLVFCQEVLEHVKDIDATVRMLARCIDPGSGAAYITIPSGFALESVLRDPHLQLFGITLLDRFEAQPVATALKNHTHYSKMMGTYYRYADYVKRFEDHGLGGVPLRPLDAGPAAVKRCARRLDEVAQKRSSLRDHWGNRVDRASLSLLEERLDRYLGEANSAFARATAADAGEKARLYFVQNYGLAHLEFIVAHRGSPFLGEF